MSRRLVISPFSRRGSVLTQPLRPFTLDSTTHHHQQQPPSRHNHRILLAPLARVPQRSFATGTRGARGHGWFVNYRAGKGGRHLQGEYFDVQLNERVVWNQAVLELGYTPIFLDIAILDQVEETTTNTADATSTLAPQFFLDDPRLITAPRHRLVIHLATTVLPETTQNFLQLLHSHEHGYRGTRWYRFERNVGVCGGDVLTNTGRAGLPAAASSSYHATRRHNPDPLALWHLPGTLTMLVPTVQEVDSRFMICHGVGPEQQFGSMESEDFLKATADNLHHLNGRHCAFGQLTPNSLEMVQKWASTVLTRSGVPTTVDFVIADCGILGKEKQEINTEKPKSKKLKQNQEQI